MLERKAAAAKAAEALATAQLVAEVARKDARAKVKDWRDVASLCVTCCLTCSAASCLVPDGVWRGGEGCPVLCLPCTHSLPPCLRRAPRHREALLIGAGIDYRWCRLRLPYNSVCSVRQALTVVVVCGMGWPGRGSARFEAAVCVVDGHVVALGGENSHHAILDTACVAAAACAVTPPVSPPRAY